MTHFPINHISSPSKPGTNQLNKSINKYSPLRKLNKLRAFKLLTALKLNMRHLFNSFHNENLEETKKSFCSNRGCVKKIRMKKKKYLIPNRSIIEKRNMNPLLEKEQNISKRNGIQVKTVLLLLKARHFLYYLLDISFIFRLVIFKFDNFQGTPE